MDYFLDTNVFLRYIVRGDPDDPRQVRLAEQAYAILEHLQAGRIGATTCEGVIVEAVQVLSSKALYNLPRPDIQRHLTNVLSLKGLKLANKRSYLRALELYTLHPFLDFVDALNIAHMERLRIPMILSFDRDFDRVPDVMRREEAAPQGGR